MPGLDEAQKVCTVRYCNVAESEAGRVDALNNGKVVVLRAAPESVALGSGTNNVSTPSVAHGGPERPAERL